MYKSFLAVYTKPWTVFRTYSEIWEHRHHSVRRTVDVTTVNHLSHWKHRNTYIALLIMDLNIAITSTCNTNRSNTPCYIGSLIGQLNNIARWTTPDVLEARHLHCRRSRFVQPQLKMGLHSRMTLPTLPLLASGLWTDITTGWRQKHTKIKNYSQNTEHAKI